MTPHQLLTAAGWQPLGNGLWRSPHSGFPLHEAEAVAAQTRINRILTPNEQETQTQAVSAQKKGIPNDN